MPQIYVTCSNCGHEFYMWTNENRPCPNCGKVIKTTSGSEIYVTCNECGESFYMSTTESKSCPNCGKLIIGPEA